MKNANKTPTLWAGALVLLLAAPAAASGVRVNYGTSAVTVPPGGEFTVELTVFEANNQFNAFEAQVSYDPSFLTFVPTTPLSNQIGPLMSGACGQSFHQFQQFPNYLDINLSLLCSQTFVTGPGVIYRVKFRAPSTEGTTQITYGPATDFYRAGAKISPLETHSLTVVVTNNPTGVRDRAPDRFSMATPVPNPRIGGGHGRFQFLLPRAGTVGLDLFDANGRRVTHRDPEAFSAGRHDMELDALDLSSGTYFARMTTGWGESQWKRWVVLK